jgi:UDP-N-acetylglucosamine 2-epimerase (non-hydrolysing)/UDP-GlcNAc3NAcA epimerase
VLDAAAVDNLRAERVHGDVELVGDVMVDVALATQPRARAQPLPSSFPQEFVLATAHRAGNVDDPQRLRALVDLLLAVPQTVILPLHPRTRARLESAGCSTRSRTGCSCSRRSGRWTSPRCCCARPAVLTDSGGVQKEAYLAGVPCVTLRDTTEWVETVDSGWNVLVDLDTQAALGALERRPPAERPDLYGDGRAGERVVAALTGARYA